MRYTTILLDLDHTLFDSEASADLAYDATLREAGVPDPLAHREAFDAINVVLWAKVEGGELSPNDVRFLRFEQLCDVAAIDADPIAMANSYVRGLGAYGELYPGARTMLEQLDEIATLGLITNGIGEVQRARVERCDLERYFDTIIISGEVGMAKPGTGIFDLAFAALGEPERTSALMVGDSLTSDIQGGINAGIDTCWYAPQASDEAAVATFTITDLSELVGVVGTVP